MPDYHYLIPLQLLGIEKNLEYVLICDSIEDAEDCFVDAKERLMDVNNWNKYSGIDGLEFKLSDSRGREAHRHARKHDHIRIEAQAEGGEYDWVAIEAIEYDDYPDQGMETFGMRLHPSVDPVHKQPGDAAYSTANDATSTFIILRRGKRLVTTYHSRNDRQDPGTAINDSWSGLTDGQWASLISGIAEPGMVKI